MKGGELGNPVDLSKNQVFENFVVFSGRERVLVAFAVVVRLLPLHVFHEFLELPLVLYSLNLGFGLANPLLGLRGFLAQFSLQNKRLQGALLQLIEVDLAELHLLSLGFPFEEVHELFELYIELVLAVRAEHAHVVWVDVVILVHAWILYEEVRVDDLLRAAGALEDHVEYHVAEQWLKQVYFLPHRNP